MNIKAKEIGLVWISVKDLQKAVTFYTTVIGLKLLEISEEYGWAELEGHEGGARLGIAQYSEDGCPVKPGQNGVISYTVDHLENAIEELHKQGAVLLGDLEEVPGHVKMQLVQDIDGNIFHIVEVLFEEHHHHEHGGCCGGH